MKRHLLFKSLLLLCALVVGSTSVWAESYTWTTASGQLSTSTTSFTVNGVTWSFTPTWSDNSKKYVSWVGGSTNCYQIGSSKNIMTALSISTSGISGTISSVEVKWSSAAANAASLAVSVGGSSFTSSSASSSSSTIQTSTYTGSGSGLLDLSFTCTTGIKLQKVTVTYTSGGGGGSSVTAPSFEPGAGAITAGSTVTLTQADADAIRYTTDGTDPTITTGTVYTDPISITKATTIKAIAIKGEEVSTVATAAYTISVAYPAFNLSTGRYFLGTEITLTSAGNTIYYNMTTDGTTPSDPTNASTEYTAPIVLSSATTKIKAIAYDAYGNKSSITDRTYTGVGPATLPFTFDGKRAAIETTTGLIHSGLASDYNSSPYLKFDSADDYVILYFDGVPGTLTFDIKGNGSGSDPWAGTFTVQTSADGETYTDLKSYTSLSSKQSESFANELASDVRYIKWIYTAKTTGNVALGNIKLTSTVDVTIASLSGFATLYTGRALDFSTLSSELKAYTATVSENTVTLTEVANIPANTGVVLKGDVKTHAVPVSASSSTAQGDLTGNTSAATAYNAFSGYDLYMLALNGEGKAQFTLVNEGSIAAGKAFLKLAHADARELNVVFADDEATGVADVRCKMADGRNDFYNLNGQKVLNPTKGLYIVNGKKVIIK